MEQISQPFALPAEAVPGVASAPSSNPVPVLLFSVGLCGFAISAAVWFRWWRCFRAAIRAATPLHLDLPIPVMASRDRLQPGVFGIRKPILLLPQGIGDRLTPEQLQSILAHELCHVRRRDNLAAAIHMMVESMSWFHPLVWWIGVVRIGAEPHVYAEGILNVCKFYLQSSLACAWGSNRLGSY
jgi:beta-lactamase regulating signal transducer with metallopeptidase domain